MKFTIMGFAQEKILEFNLDLTDVMILRWFVDFKDSQQMKKIIFEENMYYWINYDYLIQEIPVIKINSKDVLRRRLKKLEDCKVLKSKCIKNFHGSMTYYTITENYTALIKKNNHPTQKSLAPDSKVVSAPDSKVESYSSINNSSINKDICLNDFFDSIWALYPVKRGKGNIKKAKKIELYKLGFDKIKLAIERYIEDVKIRRISFPELAYKNGSTFFTSGYEDYIDEKFEHIKTKTQKTTQKPVQATNYEQREYSDDYYNSLYDNVTFIK